ncbi:MAG: FAD-dependent thymidylate synthase [archaeon]
MDYSKEDELILKRHVSDLEKNVYLVYNLPPEVVAVLFAYVSRNPNSFRDNLLKLLKGKELDAGKLIGTYSSEGIDFSQASEKAKSFHEKWVVGYGHSSVAEHAVASIAFENVSIIASKVIEDVRLASYTEKSTRYQIFDRNRYYKPKKIMDSSFAGLYEETMNYLFDVYAEIIPGMIEFMKKEFPKPKEQSEKAYDSATKARACDVVRYILPAGTLTNLAMTANARTLEWAISKFLSSPLEEMQEIGSSLKEEVKKIIPVLVKFADKNPYLMETEKALEEVISKQGLTDSEEKKEVELIEFDEDAEEKLIAALLYKYSNVSFNKAKEEAGKMSKKEKEKIIDESLKRLGPYDRPLRELEHLNYVFDILIDYGAFRDIQRHRICTQTTQLLSTSNGYSTPEEIVKAGFEKKFIECMEKAEKAYKKISKEFPIEAQYIVPLAYRKRTLFTWNLRELFHFIRLRSGREGHLSYRLLAMNLFDKINAVQPLLGKYLQVDKSLGPSRIK